MLGMVGDHVGAEIGTSSQLIIPVNNNGRIDKFREMATVGAAFCRNKQSQEQYNNKILSYGRQHRVYTHAHAIGKRAHNKRPFAAVPLTKTTASGLFGKDQFRRTFALYVIELSKWRHTICINIWRDKVKHDRVDFIIRKDEVQTLQTCIFQSWNMSNFGVIALQAGIQACLAKSREVPGAPAKQTWSSIPMFRTHFQTTGPVALIWSARMALLKPQHLAVIGIEQSKMARKRERELLETKLESVVNSSRVTIPQTKRIDLASRSKAFQQLVTHHLEIYKSRAMLTELYKPAIHPDIGNVHYIASTLTGTTKEQTNRMCSVRDATKETKSNSGWTYRDISMETAGQYRVQTDDDYVFDNGNDRQYKIPNHVCNVRRSRKLMQQAKDGT